MKTGRLGISFCNLSFDKSHLAKILENEFHIIFEYHHLQFYALILRANVNLQEIGWNI